MPKLSSIPYYISSIGSLTTGFVHPFNIFRLISNKHKEKEIQLRKSLIRFQVRNLLDVWSIKETFLDDFYHFEKSTKPENGIIIDIGAGIGEFAIQAAVECPGCQIVGFEPFPESVDLFQRNILINSLTNIEAVAAAVSSHPGEMVLDTSSGNPLQFKTRLDDKAGNPVRTIQLVDFLRNRNIPEVEIVKLDCEGGEYDILLPLPPEDLRRFKRIVMEYHDNLTPHHHNEIIEKLRNSGFDVQVEPNKVHSYIGYIYAQNVNKIEIKK